MTTLKKKNNRNSKKNKNLFKKVRSKHEGKHNVMRVSIGSFGSESKEFPFTFDAKYISLQVPLGHEVGPAQKDM